MRVLAEPNVDDECKDATEEDSGENAAAKEEVVQGTQASNIAAAVVVWIPNEGMRFLL
jgi:hypothetical protein